MQRFTVHTGQAAPLRRSNVDTDQIIPVRFLTRVVKRGYGEDLFRDWRDDEPEFVLNRAPHDTATILVAGTDFGTGSSREGAVYALVDFGFRAIIAPRFADIFKGNALKNGLLPVVLDPTEVTQLWDLLDERPDTPVTVDLERCEVVADVLRFSFDVPEDTRWRLLNGIDDISLTLAHEDDIAAYERARRPARPTTVRSGR
jgi:3-isopropylmalate/(R)-2-methylmalate dehydratase small subunit